MEDSRYRDLDVLMVEDNEMHSEYLKFLLESLGFKHLKVCRNGKIAIEEIRKKSPDLVFLDIELGGQISGFDIAQFIHSKHIIPIIFTSAKTDATTLLHAQKLPSCAFISKPYQLPDVKAAIKIVLKDGEVMSHQESGDSHSILFTRDGNELVKTPILEIDYVKVERERHCGVYVGKEKFVVRKGLREMFEILPKSHFIQIHRNCLVNIYRIERINDFEQTVLVSGSWLGFSKGYKRELMNRIRAIG